ncbi:MAG: TonB-dependent receptor [Alistipes sp.]|nr:TonB-dependent receptor [Alistipes sp.]
MIMRGLLIAILSLVALRVAAQEPHDDYYYPYAEPETRSEDPRSDSLLFYEASFALGDLYGRLTDFRLPVSSYRRGEHYASELTTLYGLPVSYRQTALLRGMAADEEYVAGVSPSADGVGGAGGQRHFRFSDAEPMQPYTISARYAMQNYRFGLRATMNRQVGGWHVGAVVEGRTGRDALVEGLFENSLRAGVRMSRKWMYDSELHLVFTLPFAERGGRSASTQEAFTLLDNPYYNPSWGYQAGKVRNARVRNDLLPMVAAHYALTLSPSTHLKATLGSEVGRLGVSALNWYDARTPLPDNYRYLPSATDDRATMEAWQRNDTRYTQLAWDEMIAQNRLGDGHAVYALEERIERVMRLGARAEFASSVERATLHYGLQINYDNSRNFKQMKDLLGATHIIDIDQFLLDDDSYCNDLENNLRAPSRRITEGDRFGYDYALTRLDSRAWLGVRWQHDRWQLGLWGEVGDVRIKREGFYEKELFPGTGSYGPSRTLHFTPYTLKGDAAWLFSPRRSLHLAVAVGTVTPSAADLFMQPLYNNLIVSNPELSHYYGVQVDYRHRGEYFDLLATAFATQHTHEMERRSYFDDLSGLYADMSVQGLVWRAVGLEVAVEWRVASRWTLSAALSAGDYRYTDDAVVNVVADNDNSTIDEAATAHLAECRPGGVPQLAAFAGLRYYGRKGWGVRLSAGFAGGRYVDPVALRRTDRVARQNGLTPEFFDAFVSQERLKDGLTVDASLFKRVWFERSSLLFSLHLMNLTGAEYPLYGYESLRTQAVGVDSAMGRLPQATRYMYGKPRRLMVTVSYNF